MGDRTEYVPAALYARVSSDRQDVDLSIAAQLRALREHADKNGYVVVREFVDEAESGRVADRPQFQEMLDEAKKPQAPFREILVWKFSRFTRKREHAVAFKSMLRRRGIRVVSITEQADDTAAGRLLEGIIETIDEFYSENLAQDVTRGMREAASRGFWMSSEAPLGYNRVMVQDGPKKRPKLDPDPDSSHVVRRMFDLSEAGKSTLDIARILNGEGITSPRGKPWGKTSVHAILINETYTGTLTWGVNAKDGADPVRVENAFPAIISTAQFNRVSELLRSRAPRIVNPRRVASPFLLSGLVKCKTCRRALTGQGSKYAQFTYYVCQTLMKQGKGSCDAPRLNARRFEILVVEKIRSNILTEGNIRDLVKTVDEKMDRVAAEQHKRLEAIDAELEDVKRHLSRIWHFIGETDNVDMADAGNHIRELRDRQELLEDEASGAREILILSQKVCAGRIRTNAPTPGYNIQSLFRILPQHTVALRCAKSLELPQNGFLRGNQILTQRRSVLDDVNTIEAYAKEMRDFLVHSELTERKAFIQSFVKEIVVMPGDALLRYTVPMPSDSLIPGKAIEKMALNDPVLVSVHRSPPNLTKSRTFTLRFVLDM